MEASLRDLYAKVAYQMEEREVSSDNSGDNSPPSTTFNASMSSPKRRRAIQKEVVTFPLHEIQGSGVKGDCTPPSDSWAWRKYGQKPIKGSPYPRGYYRCSSSKGCPAKKQVERSRTDPNTLVVTYSYEHNHPWPVSTPLRTGPRNNHRHNNNASSSSPPTTVISPTTSSLITPAITTVDTNIESQSKMESHGDQTTSFQQKMDQSEPLITPTDELTWMSSDHRIVQNDAFFGSWSDLDMSKIVFPSRDEDESLFADLGELPECSVVFRRAAGVAAGEDGKLAPATAWCGTTG